MLESVKGLVLGILLIIAVGIGGLVYRNAVEHPNQPIACPLDAKVCPDGTSLARTGESCTFPACPPPNVTLDAAGVAYAIPAGFAAAADSDPSVIAMYQAPGEASTSKAAALIIRDYQIAASSTALAVIQATAISGASGAPAAATAYSSTNIGQHHFTIVAIERFEGVVDTAYYLARARDVLRFDAVDGGVAGWADPTLDTSALPAAAALRGMLATLQGGG